MTFRRREHEAIITVIGKDKIGILAMIANECAKANINVLDVSQTIVDGFFTMTMSVDLENMKTSLSSFSDHMDQVRERKRSCDPCYASGYL